MGLWRHCRKSRTVKKKIIAVHIFQIQWNYVVCRRKSHLSDTLATAYLKSSNLWRTYDEIQVWILILPPWSFKSLQRLFNHYLGIFFTVQTSLSATLHCSLMFKWKWTRGGFPMVSTFLKLGTMNFLKDWFWRVKRRKLLWKKFS